MEAAAGSIPVSGDSEKMCEQEHQKGTQFTCVPMSTDEHMCMSVCSERR